jgi:hypothetical protein
MATVQQGRRLTAAERKAVEEQAMAVAAEELRDRGWTTITRTAETKSWDYEVARKGSKARVEVKGSTGLISKIELTRNEVASARTFPHSMLVLVSRIAIAANGREASGGAAQVVDPWVLDESRLVPERYSYSPHKRP